MLFFIDDGGDDVFSFFISWSCSMDSEDDIVALLGGGFDSLTLLRIDDIVDPCPRQKKMCDRKCSGVVIPHDQNKTKHLESLVVPLFGITR